MRAEEEEEEGSGGERGVRKVARLLSCFIMQLNAACCLSSRRSAVELESASPRFFFTGKTSELKKETDSTTSCDAMRNCQRTLQSGSDIARHISRGRKAVPIGEQKYPRLSARLSPMRCAALCWD